VLLELFAELLERDHLQMPAGVIGVTGFEDAEARAKERFPALKVVRYEAETDGWVGVVEGTIRQISRAKASRDNATPLFGSAMAIVCALEDPELSSVLKNGWKWEPVRIAGDHTNYFQSVVDVKGTARSVVCASAARMGMPATAVLAAKIIQTFRPRIIAMPGIAAGVKGRTNLGDVIIADPSWDWGNGKWTSQNGEPQFMPAPHQIALHQEIRNKVSPRRSPS
jgi:hypothetical protein